MRILHLLPTKPAVKITKRSKKQTVCWRRHHEIRDRSEAFFLLGIWRIQPAVQRPCTSKQTWPEAADWPAPFRGTSPLTLTDTRGKNCPDCPVETIPIWCSLLTASPRSHAHVLLQYRFCNVPSPACGRREGISAKGHVELFVS